MTAASILKSLSEQGFTINVADNQHLRVSPFSKLSDAQCRLLRANKAEIVALLREAKATTDTLVKAAMLACDYFNDGLAARDLMEAECLATPPHLQAGLREHFLKTYTQKS